MNGASTSGGLSSALSLSGGALRFFSVALQVESHNIANVSTKNFLPQKEAPAAGPNGRGVELQAVFRDAPNHGLELPVSGQAPARTKIADRLSGAELAKELPRMISTQRAFEANTKTAVVVDDMFGSLLDVIA